MSLRLRLALWYGGLTGVVLALVSIMSYAIHTRAHYDDLDRVMVQATEHVAGEYRSAPTTDHLQEMLTNPVAPDVVMRAYDANGALLPASPATAPAPAIDPHRILANPAGHAYDRIARLAPPLVDVHTGQGGFGITADAEGNRWRLYALPVAGTDAYLLTAAPLERIDMSVRRFRRLMVFLSTFGAGVTVLAGTVIAGRALRPVATLTATAAGIARARTFERRVPVGNQADELGRLGTTFNVMLDSLEQAFRAQQRFVSDASHELRAPLTVIQANLEFVEGHPGLPNEARREALREAGREASRLATLVGDLLALARADAGVELQRRPVELDRVLLDALADARHLARGQALQVEELEPVEIQGDPDRLKQLVLILLDNAIKYTPAPGAISLSLWRRDEQAELIVRDEGVGIRASDLEHVFERFYRADPARSRDPGGTGLGLPIARWIARQHGGDVTLDSAPDLGTTATVRLPLS